MHCPSDFEVKNAAFEAEYNEMIRAMGANASHVPVIKSTPKAILSARMASAIKSSVKSATRSPRSSVTSAKKSETKSQRCARVFFLKEMDAKYSMNLDMNNGLFASAILREKSELIPLHILSGSAYNDERTMEEYSFRREKGFTLHIDIQGCVSEELWEHVLSDVYIENQNYFAWALANAKTRADFTRLVADLNEMELWMCDIIAPEDEDNYSENEECKREEGHSYFCNRELVQFLYPLGSSEREDAEIKLQDLRKEVVRPGVQTVRVKSGTKLVITNLVPRKVSSRARSSSSRKSSCKSPSRLSVSRVNSAYDDSVSVVRCLEGETKDTAELDRLAEEQIMQYMSGSFFDLADSLEEEVEQKRREQEERDRNEAKLRLNACSSARITKDFSKLNMWFGESYKVTRAQKNIRPTDLSYTEDVELETMSTKQETVNAIRSVQKDKAAPVYSSRKRVISTHPRSQNTSVCKILIKSRYSPEKSVTPTFVPPSSIAKKGASIACEIKLAQKKENLPKGMSFPKVVPRMKKGVPKAPRVPRAPTIPVKRARVVIVPSCEKIVETAEIVKPVRKTVRIASPVKTPKKVSIPARVKTPKKISVHARVSSVRETLETVETPLPVETVVRSKAHGTGD